MLKRVIAMLLLSASAGTAVFAHHSYAEYYRDQKVAIEGVVDHVTIANPHAILVVRTDEGTSFTVEWQSASQLQRSGFTDGMLAAGDRVIVTASPARNPETRRVTLVTEVRRPRDGWTWTRAGVALR